MNSIQYLLSIEPKGIKLGLERTFQLMEACGSPHKNLPCIQVVGTNGKGSTSAMIASIFKTAGYKVGLFTSPHLVHVNERIRINGVSISNKVIDDFIQRTKDDIERIDASFFEVLTTLGMWYFQREKVDITILETGLGGRFDSVSVCNPSLLVFTPISLDHVEILGDSLEKITIEKAGAIRKNVKCISVKQQLVAQNILTNTAKVQNAEMKFVELSNNTCSQVSLKGNHQLQNAQLAKEACLSLNQFTISEDNISTGLQNVVWPGRFQIIQNNPFVVFDVGHNKDGIICFLNEFSKTQSDNKTLILSVQSRKNISDIVPRIEMEFDTIVCSQTNNKHSMDATILKSYFSDDPSIVCEPNLNKAIRSSLSNSSSNDSIAIVGSHYMGSAIQDVFEISFD
jgi:dihydrofolate synthase/folylpolyglutamate synthase